VIRRRRLLVLIVVALVAAACAADAPDTSATTADTAAQPPPPDVAEPRRPLPDVTMECDESGESCTASVPHGDYTVELEIWHQPAQVNEASHFPIVVLGVPEWQLPEGILDNHDTYTVSGLGDRGSATELRCGPSEDDDVCTDRFEDAGFSLDEFTLDRRVAVSRAIVQELSIEEFQILAVGSAVPVGQAMAANPPPGLRSVTLVATAEGRWVGPANTSSEAAANWEALLRDCRSVRLCRSRDDLDAGLSSVTPDPVEPITDATAAWRLGQGAAATTASVAVLGGGASPRADIDWILTSGGRNWTSACATAVDVDGGEFEDVPDLAPAPICESVDSALADPVLPVTAVRSGGDLVTRDLEGARNVVTSTLGADPLLSSCSDDVVVALLAGDDVPACNEVDAWQRLLDDLEVRDLEETIDWTWSGLEMKMLYPAGWMGEEGFYSNPATLVISQAIDYDHYLRRDMSEGEWAEYIDEQFDVYLATTDRWTDRQTVEVRESWRVLQSIDAHNRLMVAFLVLDDEAFSIALWTRAHGDDLVDELMVRAMEAIEDHHLG